MFWPLVFIPVALYALGFALRGRVVAAYRTISLGAAVAGPPIGVAIAGLIGSRGLFAVASLACWLMFIPFHRRITAPALAERIEPIDGGR